jgi:hypothetical protein
VSFRSYIYSLAPLLSTHISSKRYFKPRSVRLSYGTICTCVRVRIHAYEYASRRMHLAGTIRTCVRVRIHAYEYASRRTHPVITICTCVRVCIHAYEYASSNPACISRRSSEFCYFKALSWHSTCTPSSVRPPGRPQIPVLPNSYDIISCERR